MSQERLIKKYANRRLYDASQSRHITLDDGTVVTVLGLDGESLCVNGNDLLAFEESTIAGESLSDHCAIAARLSLR